MWETLNQVIYVSATPAEYERTRSGQIVEQVIRPTGLLDPIVEVRPIDGQIDDLIGPRDSQESSPTPQFKSINSLVLSLLHSPTLTSIHDHRKNYGLD